MLDIMHFELFTQLFTEHMHTCNQIHFFRQPMFFMNNPFKEVSENNTVGKSAPIPIVRVNL